MKQYVLHTMLALGLVFSTGCLIRSGPGSAEGSNGGGGVAGAGDGPALVVQNASSNTICYVHFSSTNQGSWGPDRLGSSEVINPGQTRGWHVPPDRYDVQLKDCSHNTLLDQRAVAIGGDGIMLTYR